ncbi:MAG: NAD-dependent epimerase/dehydratase family protein [Rikenellaceae bacterium]
MKNRSVVVTAAAGFVGAHLIAALINNNYTDITAIVHNNRSLPKLKYILNLYNIDINNRSVKIVIGELTDYLFIKEIFQGKNIVFNTAAVVSFSKSRESEMISSNVRITECLTEAARECGIDKFVHVSSIAALGTTPYPEKITENSIIQTLQSKSAYGISKFLSENVVWKASSRGLNCTVALPAVILGNGDPRYGGSPKLTKLYSKCTLFYTEGITGYVSVEDVVRALILMSEKDESTGQRYVLCSENLSFREIFTLCSTSEPKYKLPDWLLTTAKHVIQFINTIGITTPVSSSTLDTLREKCAYNGDKITKQLSFNYTPLKRY